MQFRLCLSSLVLVAIGCGTVKDNPDAGSPPGGDDAPPATTSSFTLSATPTALDIPIASAASITLTVDRTGTPGDITLSAGSLPAGITIAFASTTIAATAASTTATIAIAPGTPAGLSSLTITGSATSSTGASEKTVTLAVTAKTITVSGTVRGARPGVMVRLVGKPAVTSDDTGHFAFEDVSPPYDLYALGSTGLFGNQIPSVFYYQGLTRSDPVIIAPSTLTFVLLPVVNTDNVKGTTPIASGTTMIVAWETGNTTGRITTSGYQVIAAWPQSVGTTTTGTLFGFQFATDPMTDAPSNFTGYTSKLVTVTSGDSMDTTADLVMAPPATAALTGTITTPDGFPKPNLTLTQQLGATGSVVLWQTSASTTSANATIPLVGAGKAALLATAGLNGASTQVVFPALAAATNVTFALPPPAAPTAPLNGATGVTATTPFTWSPTPGAIYEVSLSATGGGAKALFQLYTTATTGTLPVVPELALPLNQAFSWRVNSFGPSASIDEVATETALEGVLAADFEGPVHWSTTGASRTFTSAP